MSPFEVRLQLLQLATTILQASAEKPSAQPTAEQVVATAEQLNLFVSSKSPNSLADIVKK